MAASPANSWENNLELLGESSDVSSLVPTPVPSVEDDFSNESISRTSINDGEESPIIDPNFNLRELNVRDFSLWCDQRINDIVEKKVAKENISEELAEVKKSLTLAHLEIADLKREVESLQNGLNLGDSTTDDPSEAATTIPSLATSIITNFESSEKIFSDTSTPAAVCVTSSDADTQPATYVPTQSMASQTPESNETVTSFGPAGSEFNVREAGGHILNIFCDDFPSTDVSCIIPALFGDNITELLERRDDLTRKQEDQFCGRKINQEGERHELVVFNIFNRLIRQEDISPPLLVMRTFEMDTKNRLNLKRNALISLLPNIRFSEEIKTDAENDFVILVKNLGVVFVEAKGSTIDNMVRSAEKQLHNVNGIVQCIMKAITKDEKRIIPTMKLIMIPDCEDETPSEPTDQGSYFVFKDKCSNFVNIWKDVIDKLKQLRDTNPFSTAEFKELSDILVGIWSAKSVGVMQNGSQTHKLQQDDTKLSFAKQLEHIDGIVDTSTVRNENQFKLKEDKLNPWTKIVRTNESDVFRSSNSLKLCYLTPAQKQLFSHQKQAIVRSPAGCGKSLLILFKVLELVKDQTSDSKILIVAPAPHDIRIRNALQSNNVQVQMIDQFPPPPSFSKVFIMELDDFFDVKVKKLMRYDLSNYHFFVDDLHNIEFSRGNSFSSVGDFVEKIYEISALFDTYLWIMLDGLQGQDETKNDVGHGKYPLEMFSYNVSSAKMRDYNIPIVKLSHVMRNTENIMKFNKEARDIIDHNIIQSSKTRWLPSGSPRPQPGHRVTSHTPVYHRLQQDTNDKNKSLFIISRLRETIGSIAKPPIQLPLSSVALIYDSEGYFGRHRADITSFLINDFRTTPQTVQQQLVNNNTTDVVMDVVDNIMSFETPVVVFIRTCTMDRSTSANNYKISTRARVSLTIIDVSSSSELSIPLNSVDLVKWELDSDNFVKCT